MVDASKILYLKDTSLYPVVLKFLMNLDTNNLDNLYEDLIKDEKRYRYADIFDIITRLFFYISFLVNTKYPENCSFKIVKHYITKEKVLLKVLVKEL